MAVFRISITGALISLGFLLFFGCQLAPLMSDGQQLVRIRNSLLFEEGGAFDWQPEQPPQWFTWETAPAPPFLKAINAELYSATLQPDNFEKSLIIVRHLHPFGRAKGGMLATDTQTTYRKILDSGEGYCADYTQVFTALALTSKIPVREWGISFDHYSGDGHAFNEIYSNRYLKWIFLDPFNGFYVTDSAGLPVSYTELKTALLNRNFDALNVVPVNPAFFPFASDEAALQYIEQGATMSYLWTSNAIFSYESSFVVQATSKISRYVEQAVAILAGVHPRIMLDSYGADPNAIRQLSKTRSWTIGLALSATTLILSLMATIHIALRHRKPKSDQRSDQFTTLGF